MRLMADALATVPQEAAFPLIAYYPDAITLAEVRTQFPGKLYVSIARTASEDALVGDVENGDLTPNQLPAWVTRQRSRGTAYPWSYVNRSNWPSAKGACVAAGVDEPLWWVADPTSGGVIPAGAVAVQYSYLGIYDVSNVVDFIPGLDQEDPYMFDPIQLWDGATAHLIDSDGISYVVTPYPGQNQISMSDELQLQLSANRAAGFAKLTAAGPTNTTGALPPHTHQVAEVPGPTGEPIAG